MRSLAFFDTNILVYADDESSGVKLALARELVKKHMDNGTAVISLQVLQEYYAVATRKLGLPADRAQQRVRVLAEGQVVCFEARDIISAIELHRLTRVSFRDALIVQAARSAGVAVLYSEALQHDSSLGGVRIVNPFVNA